MSSGGAFKGCGGGGAARNGAETGPASVLSAGGNTGELLIGTTIVMVLMCIIASGLALLRLRKVEPGMVFR